MNDQQPMTEAEGLRLHVGVLMRRIDCQRREIARLSTEVTALSSLVSRYSKDYYTLRKQVDQQVSQLKPTAP